MEVPDHLWRYVEFGNGKKYSDNQAEDMATQTEVFADLDAWADAFVSFVRGKGKVEPGAWRAYGFERKGHLWKDVKLLWRDARMRVGLPPKDSSPAAQQAMGLNEVTGLRAGKSEGEKLRE